MRHSITCAAAALALAAGGLAPWAGASAETVSWDMSVWGPPRAYTKGVETLAEVVSRETDGKFTITIHYGETISPARENLDGVSLNAFEAATFCSSYHPGKNPALTGLDLPFLPVDDIDALNEVHKAYYAHPVVQEELGRWNAVAFMPTPLPLYEFMGRGNPPKSLDDWSRMRVRALGGLGDAMRELGAVPTTVPAPEIYTSLERGVINAAAVAYTYMHVSYRLHEISRWYTTNLAPGTVGCGVVVNQGAYERLPEEYRRILDDARQPAYEAMRDAYAEADEKNLPLFEQRGLEAITYSPEERAEFEERAARPVWDKWAEDMTGRGLPGQELLEFILEAARQANAS